jgi:adenylosuccinate lyase
MAYKRNPMLCERVTGLARYVLSAASSPFQTAAEQWLERSLDDSSNKRIVIPELFLATDGMLRVITHVARGLVVYPKIIRARIEAELPFMATEEILMAGVAAGGDRQALHEVIRVHSRAAAARVKQEGKENHLIALLAADARFKRVNLKAALEPKRFIGRAPEQVEAFVKEHVAPIRRRLKKSLGAKVDLEV